MLKIIVFYHGSHPFLLLDILEFYFNKYVMKVNEMHASNHQTSSTYWTRFLEMGQKIRVPDSWSGAACPCQMKM